MIVVAASVVAVAAKLFNSFVGHQASCPRSRGSQFVDMPEGIR